MEIQGDMARLRSAEEVVGRDEDGDGLVRARAKVRVRARARVGVRARARVGVRVRARVTARVRATARVRPGIPS